MSQKPLYSTATGPSGKTGKQRHESSNKYVVSEGPCRMRLEKKGRGGKVVTVVFDLPFEKDVAKELMKDIQNTYSCGASLKGSTIEFRGDMCEKISQYFDEKKLKIIRAGG